MPDTCPHCSTRFDRFGRCESCDAKAVECRRHNAKPGELCNGGDAAKGYALCAARRMDGAKGRAA